VKRRRLPRAFYKGDAGDVAPALLGKVLVHEVAGVRRSGRIVEVEAYRAGLDPASHAYRGPTPRNRTMFGPPGHLYVYRSYGIHFCVNAVCAGGHAVLVRAVSPLEGTEEMGAARTRPGLPPPPDRDLCRGPGRVGQAFGFDLTHDGADLVTGDLGVTIEDDGWDARESPAVGPRVGISVAVDEPWRYWIRGDRNVSRTSRTRVR
jgi:DNA-3-methyladenine glycosylase